MDLSSNDYLGLAEHPWIRQRLQAALADGIPLGSGGSRLLRGNTAHHEAAERAVADFAGAPAALMFNSGYDANVGVITTLTGAGDRLFADELVHASMIDGMRQTKAVRHNFRHNDMAHLRELLARDAAEHMGRSGTRFILIESVYSMDGDVAPLQEIVALAEQYEAFLIVDEAHATGVFGPQGRGLCAAQGMGHVPLVTLHTCGKAWSSFGAFVTCSEAVKQRLINRCRNFIFTTAMPPLTAVHHLAVLDVLQHESWRAEKVLALAQRFRDHMHGRLDMGQSVTQIVPVILGTDQRACFFAESLQAGGYDIRAIRPPTVPRGSARLRLAFNAKLDEADVDRLAALMGKLLLQVTD
nr:8-amino-7-oxononanoate synthase [Acanthopleuribacter pedis]